MTNAKTVACFHRDGYAVVRGLIHGRELELLLPV